MDLEEFIVLGAQEAIHDPRVFTSFILVSKSLAPILSPFKIKKIATKKLVEKQFHLLGFILSQIQASVRNPLQWTSLIEFCKRKQIKNDRLILFHTRSFKTPSYFEDWNIQAASLELDHPEKYIDRHKLYSHSLVKKRLSGMKTVFSDMAFYREFFEDHSLNQMAKNIYHDYRSVYLANELISLADSLGTTSLRTS